MESIYSEAHVGAHVCYVVDIQTNIQCMSLGCLQSMRTQANNILKIQLIR